MTDGHEARDRRRTLSNGHWSLGVVRRTPRPAARHRLPGRGRVEKGLIPENLYPGALAELDGDRHRWVSAPCDEFTEDGELLADPAHERNVSGGDDAPLERRDPATRSRAGEAPTTPPQEQQHTGRQNGGSGDSRNRRRERGHPPFPRRVCARSTIGRRGFDGWFLGDGCLNLWCLLRRRGGLRLGRRSF